MRNETNPTVERWNDRADCALAPLVVSLVGIVWAPVAVYVLAFLLDSQSTNFVRVAWVLVASIPGLVAFRLKDRAMDAAGGNPYARGLVWAGVVLGIALVVVVVGVALFGMVSEFVSAFTSEHR